MPAIIKYYILDDVIETELRFYDTAKRRRCNTLLTVSCLINVIVGSISFDKQYLILITENNYVRKRNRVVQNCKLET